MASQTLESNPPEALLPPDLFPNPGAFPLSLLPDFPCKIFPFKPKPLTLSRNKTPSGCRKRFLLPYVTALAFFPLQGLDPKFIKPKLCLHAGQKFFGARLKLPGIFLESSGKATLCFPSRIENSLGIFLPFGVQGMALPGEALVGKSVKPLLEFRFLKVKSS